MASAIRTVLVIGRLFLKGDPVYVADHDAVKGSGSWHARWDEMRQEDTRTKAVDELVHDEVKSVAYCRDLGREKAVASTAEVALTLDSSWESCGCAASRVIAAALSSGGGRYREAAQREHAEKVTANCGDQILTVDRRAGHEEQKAARSHVLRGADPEEYSAGVEAVKDQRMRAVQSRHSETQLTRAIHGGIRWGCVPLGHIAMDAIDWAERERHRSPADVGKRIY